MSSGSSMYNKLPGVENEQRYSNKGVAITIISGTKDLKKWGGNQSGKEYIAKAEVTLLRQINTEVRERFCCSINQRLGGWVDVKGS